MMKRKYSTRLLFAGFAGLILVAAYSCSTRRSPDKELVAFYDVPLECGAAPDIGCGSRAKPVFIEAGQHKGVREIWLNRPGTVIAVVGDASISESGQIDGVIAPIFKKFDLSTVYVGDPVRHNTLMADFRQDGKWYQGTDVDKLSIEEAGRMAERAVMFAREAGLINETEAGEICSDVEMYLKEDLVKVRTFDELVASETPRYDAVHDIYKKHIGNERAANVRKFYEEHEAE